MPSYTLAKQQMIVWLETTIITLVFISLGIYFFKNPLILNQGFAWGLFAPIFIALRYGFWPALFSFSTLWILTLLFFPLKLVASESELLFLSGFLLVMLCASFQKFWQIRIKKSEAISDYLKLRVENLGNAYNLTLLSSQQLEQSLIMSPVTLRSALEELRQLLAVKLNNITPALAERFLNLLNHYCSVNTVALYTYHKQKLNTKPIASIGHAENLDVDDPLIKKTLVEKMVNYVAINQLQNIENSKYLVSVPLLIEEELFGLLVVKEMPFMQLNEKNLQTLTLLVDYFCQAFLQDQAKVLLQAYPDCPTDFANELFRLKRIQQRIKVDSALTVFHFADLTKSKDYIFRINQERRRLDSIWQIKNKTLIILMPLVGRAAMELYRKRISQILQENFGDALNEHSIQLRSYQLSENKSMLKLIEEIIKHQ